MPGPGARSTAVVEDVGSSVGGSALRLAGTVLPWAGGLRGVPPARLREAVDVLPPVPRPGRPRVPIGITSASPMSPSRAGGGERAFEAGQSRVGRGQPARRVGAGRQRAPEVVE